MRQLSARFVRRVRDRQLRRRTSPRARLIVVRARRPVTRAHARGEDPGAVPAFLFEYSGRKIVFLCLPRLYAGFVG